MSFRTIVHEDPALRRDPLRAAAKEAIARGWHVFPCERGGKQPATPHGWKDARPEVTKWPRGSNVGIACGPSGLLVVDLDVKHNIDGVIAFEEWAGEWPNSYEVETPSGGVHLYFTDPAGHFNCGTGTLPRGIDIRGRGGYVLGVGSVVVDKKHPEWSGKYRGLSKTLFEEVEPDCSVE
ncbi:MAG: bifunctional DNA primase/polymerase [Acidimicrobiales bacterium]